MQSLDLPPSRNVREFAHAHRLSVRTVYRLMDSGALDARKVGRRTIITAEAERCWIASLPTKWGAK